jgi:hypothetical protein
MFFCFKEKASCHGDFIDYQKIVTLSVGSPKIKSSGSSGQNNRLMSTAGSAREQGMHITLGRKIFFVKWHITIMYAPRKI